MLLIPVNDILLSDRYGKLFESLNNGSFNIDHFTSILVIMMILQIGWGIDDIHSAKQTPDFQHFCRKKMINTIFEKLDNNYSDLFTGDLISKILRTEHILMSWYNRIFSFLIPYTLELLIAMYMIYKIDYKLSLTLLLISVIFLFTIKIAPNKCSNDKNDNLSNNIHEEVDDMLSNYQTIFKNDTLSKELLRLNGFNEKYKKKFMNTIHCTIKYRVVQSIIIMCFFTYFIYRSYTLLKLKKIERAAFYTSLIVVKQIVNNFVHTIDISRDLTVDYDILRNTGFFNNNIKKNITSNNCVSSSLGKTILEMKNVWFKYDSQKKYILYNINWKINEGDKIALVGEIGSGKSTLIKIILKIVNPTKGAVTMNGRCYSEIATRELHNRIGFMPQNCVLFNRTLTENIQYGNKRRIKEVEILTLLKDNNITTFDNLRNGLQTLCGKNGNNLSGGQRQLVWFIRMYFSNPTIVLLDEPTASLDEKAKNTLLYLINTLLKDKTTIIVTHDPYMIDNIENVININALNN